MRKIIYHPKVVHEDIPQLDSGMTRRIQGAIESKLNIDPVGFGMFLHGSLHGYRKLRVGDWRIVYKLVGQEVRIIAIGKRKDKIVYKTASKRVR